MMKQIRQLFQVSVMLYFEGCIYSHFAWGYIKLCNLAIVTWSVCLLACLSVIPFAHHKIPVPHFMNHVKMSSMCSMEQDNNSCWPRDITERGNFFYFFKFQHHPTFNGIEETVTHFPFLFFLNIFSFTSKIKNGKNKKWSSSLSTSFIFLRIT